MNVENLNFSVAYPITARPRGRATSRETLGDLARRGEFLERQNRLLEAPGLDVNTIIAMAMIG
jgi:hypothetical protein